MGRSGERLASFSSRACFAKGKEPSITRARMLES